MLLWRLFLYLNWQLIAWFQHLGMVSLFPLLNFLRCIKIFLSFIETSAVSLSGPEMEFVIMNLFLRSAEFYGSDDRMKIKYSSKDWHFSIYRNTERREHSFENNCIVLFTEREHKGRSRTDCKGRKCGTLRNPRNQKAQPLFCICSGLPASKTAADTCNQTARPSSQQF